MFRIHTVKLFSSNLTALFVHKQVLSSPGFTSTTLLIQKHNSAIIELHDLIRVSHYCVWYVWPRGERGCSSTENMARNPIHKSAWPHTEVTATRTATLLSAPSVSAAAALCNCFLPPHLNDQPRTKSTSPTKQIMYVCKCFLKALKK
jgi:hypothetical protein